MKNISVSGANEAYIAPKKFKVDAAHSYSTKLIQSSLVKLLSQTCSIF